MALIPTEPKQQKALMAGIAALAVLYAANSFWLDPKRELVAADEATLEALEGSNRSAMLLATQGGRDLEERMALYERHISQLERLIPAQEQLSVLISDITSLGRSVGVDIQSLRPDGSEPVGAYTKETYAWSATGEYHDVARFLTMVASMERIVTPVDMDIQVFDDPLGTVEGPTSPVLATFRIQTYVIPDDLVDDGGLPPLPGGDQ
jgi:type IV pilus assembly protein PilO